MNTLFLTKQIGKKNIIKIVLFIGLFFLILALSFKLIPIIKDNPILISNNKEISEKVALNSNDKGLVKGLSTQQMPVDNSDDTKTIWQDFIDERLELTQPKVALAASTDQSDNFSNNTTINQSDNQLTSQQSTQTSNQPNQSTSFTITNFQPKDKSGFTQGDKIIFKVEAKDTINTGLILYKYYIDSQPISDWTDKNSLEWVTTNTSAPAKHTATVEAKNIKSVIISQTNEFFLYLKPIGFE
ncbi:MAG: hypothetical protein ACD_58C00304G0003 [uncultured bacterium]|nr:MAG: hypothetical protein ACD_58C00304G0003 [uncultured bacterium]